MIAKSIIYEIPQNILFNFFIYYYSMTHKKRIKWISYIRILFSIYWKFHQNYLSINYMLWVTKNDENCNFSKLF